MTSLKRNTLMKPKHKQNNPPYKVVFFDDETQKQHVKRVDNVIQCTKRTLQKYSNTHFNFNKNP